MDLKIAELIANLIAGHAGLPPGTPLAEGTDLYRAGMKSYAAVQLMVALEEAFAIQFPDEMLSRDTFRTPAAIARAVARLTSGPAAA